MASTPPFVSTLIIPTGIGASIGGFGGDAMTVLRLLASISDTVITHPNVANAACFQDLPRNALYVEGYALDRFFKAEWALQPVHQNTVGVVFDSGMEEGMKILHRNTIEAVKTTYGTPITSIEETSEAVSIQLNTAQSGRSCGEINNINCLFEACERLIQKGATAIALCVNLPELDEENNSDYSQGKGIDPISGIEAMLSHAVVERFKLPCANAPVFTWDIAEPVRDKLLDPRACSEFIAPTFLPCVLQGLQRAPQYKDTSSQTKHTLDVSDVSVVIVPSNAMGSIPVFSALERNIPILAVQNNSTVMNTTPDSLGLDNRSVISCENYLEALAHCIALKEGIAIPPHILVNQLTLPTQVQYV